jgi:hypothetical protein
MARESRPPEKPPTGDPPRRSDPAKADESMEDPISSQPRCVCILDPFRRDVRIARVRG